MNLDTVTQSDALAFVKGLPDDSVNCVVTSPPYFGLRDYGVDGQWGLENTPAEHVARMVELFREVRRALRDDGVLWLNYGDTYSASGRGAGGESFQKERESHGRISEKNNHRAAYDGFMPKNLLGMPWRVAFGLQDDGWILRSDIIWSKPNPMPESVTDRPTKAHEYVFLFSKSQKYWYDQEAVKETAVNGDPTSPRGSNGVINNPLNSGARADKQSQLGKRQYTGFNERWDSRPEPLTVRNLRTVWQIATEPTPFAHFATFPQKLVERCILAGCPPKVCSSCGMPYARLIEARGGTIGKSWHPHEDDSGKGMSQYSGLSGGAGNAKDVDGNFYHRIDKGFQPGCTCHADTKPGVVLDPFMGSGTVALVARRLGRHYIGSELNPEYVELCNKRLAEGYTLPLPMDY